MLIWFILVIAAVLGSFSSLVLERNKLNLSVIYPASHCLRCQHPLAAKDLIPILSFILLRGRCRYCLVKIPRISFFIELYYVLIAWLCYFGQLTPSSAICLIMALLLSIEDIYHWAFSLNIWLILTLPLFFFTPLKLTFFLLLFSTIPIAFFDIPIGIGDCFFLASLSLTLSTYQLIWCVLVASACGLIVCGLTKKKRLPFVPFLSIGYFISYFLIS